MKARTLQRIYKGFDFDVAIEDLRKSITYGNNTFGRLPENPPNESYVESELLKIINKRGMYEEWANKCYEMSIKLERFELFTNERKGRYYDDVFKDGEVILK